MPRDDITGFILTGGRSQRMGVDKRTIPWNGGTLLTHAVEQMALVVSKLFVVGGEQIENSRIAVVPDVFPGSGPLAGIHAALAQSNTDWNLILAVDMPLVTARLLGYIAERCGVAAMLAIVPRTSGRLQPLCAGYHRDLLPEVEWVLKEDELSIHRLLERLMPGNIMIKIIEEPELIATGFIPEMLLNVNTPADLERARFIARTSHG